MSPKKLTEDRAKKAKCQLSVATGKPIRRELFDGVVPGFSLVLHPSGKKSWAFRYRANGKLSKLTIGPWPAITADKARALASAAHDAVTHGRDPHAEKKQARLATADSSSFFRAVVETYIAEYAKPKRKGWQESARLLGLRVNRHPANEPWQAEPMKGRPVAVWGSRPLDTITTDDVHAVYKNLKGPTPYIANRTYSALRKFFNWCVQDRRLKVSPLLGYRPDLAPEVQRERCLNHDEIRSLWAACGQCGVYGAAVKMLLLTGQRRSEVVLMPWAELSPDRALWSLPKGRTKNGRPHTVPLVPLAQTLLLGNGPYVFPPSAIGSLTRSKARLDEAMPGVAPWRVHDLRRTCATGMADLGVAPHIIEAVLNHVSGFKAGVAGIYNRARYEPEKRAALELWAAEVARIVAGVPVATLRPGAAS
jgi:integrase